ncbi:hypothetical protein PV646_28670 [Streptomyces sp. ID05-26A]|nr:hypothetical protein [Streptomyces sp. ID05-26A]
MDLSDVARIFEQSTESAFRLETLPQYLVPQEEDALAAWRAGDRQLDTPADSPWLARVKATTDQGYRWSRVHVLDYPLSEYSEFELFGYQANQAAGEEVFVADRSSSPELEDLREDFWVVDDVTVIRMVYDAEGRFVRPELPDDTTPYLEMRSIALRHSDPLSDFLARREPRLIA